MYLVCRSCYLCLLEKIILESEKNINFFTNIYWIEHKKDVGSQVAVLDGRIEMGGTW